MKILRKEFLLYTKNRLLKDRNEKIYRFSVLTKRNAIILCDIFDIPCDYDSIRKWTDEYAIEQKRDEDYKNVLVEILFNNYLTKHLVNL